MEWKVGRGGLDDGKVEGNWQEGKRSKKWLLLNIAVVYLFVFRRSVCPHIHRAVVTATKHITWALSVNGYSNFAQFEGITESSSYLASLLSVRPSLQK